MERRVDFFSDGLKLAAVLWLPEDLRPGEWRPGVVMAVGFGGEKAFSVPGFARLFMERGYVALTFDYRGFGESEGAKRRLIPAEQVHDIHAATTFLSAQDVVDPARLAICGVSFGGGNAVMAAANDDRLRCVISVNGVADGEDWLRSLRPYWEWRALLRRIEADRVRRAVTGQSEWVDLYEIMVPDPATREAHRKTFAVAPERHHDLPLETAEAVIAPGPSWWRTGWRPGRRCGSTSRGIASCRWSNPSGCTSVPASRRSWCCSPAVFGTTTSTKERGSRRPDGSRWAGSSSTCRCARRAGSPGLELGARATYEREASTCGEPPR